MVITAGSIWYSNSLVTKLGEEEEKKVKLYAEALEFIGNIEDGNEEIEVSETQFVFTKIIKKVDLVPTILVDGDGNITSHQNLGIKSGLSQEDSISAVKKELERMRQSKTNPPIEIKFYGQINTVYYDESSLLKRLRIFPYLQLLVIFVFITIVFISYSVAKKSEQNKVWVGLAKETAHQLGTPVSSLLAWVELLKLKSGDKPEDQEWVMELDKDVKRLETITERFSKIGSKPELKLMPVSDLLESSADYIRKRLPRRVTLEIENRIPESALLPVNEPLFAWVIENLLKNALDAIQGEGNILIRTKETTHDYFIDITDNGKGILRQNFEEIFKPGFTTKKRGWGLGLSLTRRIIQDYHKGRIFVQYSELGKGTTFRIQLHKKST